MRTLITFFICLGVCLGFTSPSHALFDTLTDEIQYELDANPFLENEGIKLRVTDEKNGYVTIEMYDGNREIRGKINKGIDIFTSQIKQQVTLSGTNEDAIKTVNILRQAITYVKNLKGVKDVLLIAAINTQKDKLSDIHEKGLELIQQLNDPEAAKWFRIAAEQGYAESQNNLGFLYYNGQGVTKDYAEAAKWWRMAAEQGIIEAQRNLGLNYYKGEGVSKDYAETAKWFRMAAEQGDAKAQTYLGQLYTETKDYEGAVKWFRIAADQGNVKAQKQLAWIYATSEYETFLIGEEAVKYAFLAYVNEPHDWSIVGTLAVAYARNGQFELAIKYQEECIRLLEKIGTPEEKQKFLEEENLRLKLFKNGKPYTDKN